MQVVRDLAAHISGWCRIDLYAGDGGIFFSEFTFTPFACPRNIVFKPLVVGGVVLAVANGEIDSKSVTAEFVEKTIGDKSWIHVSMFSSNSGNTTGLQVQSFGAHPSPVDLCTAVDRVANSGQGMYLRCVDEARKISTALCPLLFVIVINGGKTIASINNCEGGRNFSWKMIESTDGVVEKMKILEDMLRAYRWSGQNRIVGTHSGIGALSGSQKSFKSNKTFTFHSGVKPRMFSSLVQNSTA